MSDTRQDIQNGYFKGGEIGGFEFYPLNMDRLELVRKNIDQVEEDDQTLLMMGIYAMQDEDAETAAGKATAAEILEFAKQRKLNRISVGALQEISARMNADFEAIRASQTKPEGTLADEE